MNIISILKTFILEELLSGSRTEIDPDESLLSSGVLDSLALLRLISFLEDRFGVAVEEDEIIPDNFETMNAIKKLIEPKLNSDKN